MRQFSGNVPLDHPPRQAVAGRAGGTRLAGLVAGTRLLTLDGYRRIETLRAGDAVATLSGRNMLFAPIVWIGRRRANHAGTTATPHTVRLRRDAIADGMPQRDLSLAADQAIYLDGTLFLVGDLVNHTSIVWDRRQASVDYWSIRLARHDIVVAENTAVESLPDSSATAYREIRSGHLAVVDTGNTGRDDDPPCADSSSRSGEPIGWFRRMLGQEAPEPSPMIAPAGNPVPAGQADIGAEVQRVMQSRVPAAERRKVRLQIAAQRGLIGRVDTTLLANALGDLLDLAIDAAPGGRVLLTVLRQADAIQISVTDEGAGLASPRREVELRRVRQSLALTGWRLEEEDRPGEGSTLLLRVPQPRRD